MIVNFRSTRGENWASRYEFFKVGIHPQVKTLQAPRPEYCQVSFLGEDYFIDSEELVQSNYDESHTACDLLSIGHDKRDIFLFAIHADPFERRSRNPGVFASRVNQKPANNGGLTAIH